MLRSFGLVFLALSGMSAIGRADSAGKISEHRSGTYDGMACKVLDYVGPLGKDPGNATIRIDAGDGPAILFVPACKVTLGKNDPSATAHDIELADRGAMPAGDRWQASDAYATSASENAAAANVTK